MDQRSAKLQNGCDPACDGVVTHDWKNYQHEWLIHRVNDSVCKNCKIVKTMGAFDKEKGVRTFYFMNVPGKIIEENEPDCNEIIVKRVTLS